ncbi:calcium-dependent protein kinase 28-like [Pyrus x bretschneideri]|uniref:calcium-dependent protein kinase 28-like n=1 Tax=Pyrus x bretschneideri TaxID=225117 RepID=UPI00202FE17A|nr:calcium-dependent protein kinase 28-like [Pyrus x bretschneideri]
MEGCSTIKVSGSNSNNTAPATPGSNHNRKQSTTAGKQEQRPSHGPNEPPKKQVVHKPKNKLNSRSRTGVIPCGMRTDFGYDKNFDKRYTIGKLLGHGQFGYTYVATDRANGDQVAVKRIDKNKVAAGFVIRNEEGLSIVAGSSKRPGREHHLSSGSFHLEGCPLFG